MKKPDLKKLELYWTGLSAQEKREFARRCDVSISYISKIISLYRQKQQFFVGCKTAICFCRETKGYVRLEELRSDIDWDFVRGTESAASKQIEK